jgi:hypothetical protein
MNDIESDIIRNVHSNLNRTRKKGPSGHVAAGRKWDTSEKGRIWKAQTVKAKYELRDIIKKRTGMNVFANQRMTLKYAGFMRDGKTAEAKRIIDKVVANAKHAVKKEVNSRSKPNTQRKLQQKASKENSAENVATHAENPAKFHFQPIQPIQPISPHPQPRLPNSAEFPSNQFQQPFDPLDKVELPDFLD